METIVVDAVRFGHPEIMPPHLHIHGRMSCQRKHTGVMLSAQESGHIVNREMLSLRTEVPQTEIDG